MNYKDKINFFVSSEIADILLKDAENFEIYKPNKTLINKNKFFSLVINGYYNKYINEYTQKKSKIYSKLSSYINDKIELEDVSSSIIEDCFLPMITKKKGKQAINMSLKPTKDNENALIALDKTFDKYSKSTYLNWLFTEYCSLPIYERERIVFKDNYEVIVNAIKTKKSIRFKTIWNPVKIHTAIPYYICVSKEEMYNYVLCAEIVEINGIKTQTVSTYRLNRINGLSWCSSDFVINDEVMFNLNKTASLNPKYAINENEVAKVLLTEEGVKKTHRIYHDRPHNLNLVTEGNQNFFYFDGSFNQLEIYLKKLGPDAIIVSPDNLRIKLLKYYKDSFEAYTTENKNGKQ